MSKRRQPQGPRKAIWWRTTPAIGIACVLLVTIIAAIALSMRGAAPATPEPGAVIAAVEGGEQVLRMTATDRGYTPNEFQVEANKPVRLIVDGEARGCASYLVSPRLGISKRLEFGKGNVFTFTPAPGRYEFSCSMGMFDGVITAV